MLNIYYFIFGRDVAARLEINCTNVLSLACKGAAILKIKRSTISENWYEQIMNKCI